MEETYQVPSQSHYGSVLVPSLMCYLFEVWSDTHTKNPQNIQTTRSIPNQHILFHIFSFDFEIIFNLQKSCKNNTKDIFPPESFVSCRPDTITLE